MSVSFWLIAASVMLLALALHPFTSYPLSLMALARLRRRPFRRGQPPRSVALCVCAYNEEKVIRAKVENMLALRASYPHMEILVYVDAASDRTAEILGGYYPELSVINSPQRMGKTHGMNLLVGMTDAECLVFSDANVMFAPDAIDHLLAPFADPGIGLVCGHLRYGASDGNATAATGSLYWRLEEQIKRLESVSGSIIGADGSIFALRRSSHRAPPADLIDDMYVSLMVLCNGGRVVRAAQAHAFEDGVSQPQEEFRRKIRIACQAFNVHRALSPKLRRLGLIDQYKYVSHKLLRWLVIYLLAASAFTLIAGLVLAQAWTVLAVVVGVGLLAAILLATATRGPILAVRSILSAFVATGIGVWYSVRGQRFQTWSPPGSSRLAPAVSPEVTA